MSQTLDRRESKDFRRWRESLLGRLSRRARSVRLSGTLGRGLRCGGLRLGCGLGRGGLRLGCRLLGKQQAGRTGVAADRIRHPRSRNGGRAYEALTREHSQFYP